ncbi:MAG: hypothetical protein ACYCXX_13950 [Acidiferrobacter thiooxydans]
MRTEITVWVAALAAGASWAGEVQAVLYTYTGHAVGVAGLWRVLMAWGLVLAPWGWAGYVPVVLSVVAALAAGVGVWRILDGCDL